MIAASHAIGVDIGGTKIAAGLIDLSAGTVVARRHAPSRSANGGSDVLAKAVGLTDELIGEAGRAGISVAAVGIGVPELVDTSGVIRSRYNFEWMGRSLYDSFLDIAPDAMPPVHVESDVRAAARAEMLYGAGRGREVSVYVTIGTGISYCLCIEGRPYPGSHGYAIHFASSPLSMRCSACGTLQAPIVEELASGPGLARAYAKASAAKIGGAEDVLAAAEAGDSQAKAVIADAAHLLGASIGLVINMLDPDAVVIGGGLGSAAGPYFPAIVTETRSHIFAEDCRELPIVQATLGPDAGMIGAAASAVQI